jgi:hypothetical protein
MNTDPQVWQKSISTLGHQLVEALKPVAAKMGVAAEHLYGVLVRQSIVDSIANIVGFGIVAAVTANILRLTCSMESARDYVA